MEKQTILTKTCTNGKVGIVTMQTNGLLEATLDGQPIGDGFSPCTPRMVNGKKIVGAVGKLALTYAERQTVEDAIDAYRRSQIKPLSPAEQERNRIERMFDAAERLRDYPGDYFPAKGHAEDALAAWTAKYPVEAASEKAKREQEAQERKAQRDRDFASSFIGRGLD